VLCVLTVPCVSVPCVSCAVLCSAGWTTVLFYLLGRRKLIRPFPLPTSASPSYVCLPSYFCLYLCLYLCLPFLLLPFPLLAIFDMALSPSASALSVSSHSQQTEDRGELRGCDVLLKSVIAYHCSAREGNGRALGIESNIISSPRETGDEGPESTLSQFDHIDENEKETTRTSLN
jgi:hypothetical protein